MYYITARKDLASLELAGRIIRYLNKKKIEFAIDKNISLVGDKKPLNEIDPDFMLPWYNMGVIFLEDLCEYQKAKKCFQCGLRQCLRRLGR